MTTRTIPRCKLEGLGREAGTGGRLPDVEGTGPSRQARENLDDHRPSECSTAADGDSTKLSPSIVAGLQPQSSAKVPEELAMLHITPTGHRLDLQIGTPSCRSEWFVYETRNGRRVLIGSGIAAPDEDEHAAAARAVRRFCRRYDATEAMLVALSDKHGRTKQ